MKKILTFLISILITSGLFAQNDAKRDFCWLFGYDSIGHSTDSLFGNSIIDFNIKPPKAKFKYIDMNFNDDIATISDTSGKLLFYTNGIYIADSTHKPMKNGEGLNPGYFADANKEYGYICEQCSLILPKPGSNNLFYLIHIPLYLNEKSTIPEYVGEKLYYTLVDMSKNNGKGAVVEKNKVVYDSTFIDGGKLTACRHANGIDWWITIADYYVTSKLSVFLLSDKGISFVRKQEFPNGIEGGIGQAVFSPDGKKYARFNAVSIGKGIFVDIYDFDRCNGMLKNQKSWNYKTDSAYSGGIAISSNSRYLYVCSYKRIYQFDLQAQDIFSTLDTVAVYDGFKPPELKIKTHFYLAQLAPDNKIYISIPGSAKYLHVIHEPNKKGKACNVEQRGMVLPSFNYTTMPNFPNFRLGKAAQPCTVGVEDEVEKEKVKIYPNPSSNTITLDKGNNSASEIAIYNVDGQLLITQVIQERQTQVNVSFLQNGIYYCRLLGSKEATIPIKFTIIH